jgi:hypothetical protein
MHMTIGAAIKIATFLFTFFLLGPFIAALIGYAAWKGKPKSFDREMYWTVFIVAMAAAGFIFVYIQRHPHTLPDVVSFIGMNLVGALFGVSAGFGIGVFTRPKHTLPPFDTRPQDGNTDER